MDVFTKNKHRIVVLVFLIGLGLLYYFNSTIIYWVIWVLCFLITEFCGAYFIQLNFHLQATNKLNTAKPSIMLSFDDGPHAKNTPLVLDVLETHQVKAVFFLIGKNIQEQEEIVKQIVAKGHLIGNHSFSHHHLIDTWSSKKVLNDLTQCQQLIHQYQAQSLLFRPPFGVTNPRIAKVVKQLQLHTIGWNIRSYDTSTQNISKIKQRILNKLRPNSIILLHDRLDIMPELLNELIPEIKKRGFEFSIELPKSTND